LIEIINNIQWRIYNKKGDAMILSAI